MKKKKKVIARFFKKLLLFVSTTALIVGLVIFLKSDFFSIKQIACQFNGGVCPMEVRLELMSLFQGKNILAVSTQALADQLQLKYPNFKSLKIEKKFPQALAVKIEKRSPQAVVQKGEEFFVVDDQGFVLGREPIAGLPVILFAGSLDQPELVWTTNLLKKMETDSFEPKKTQIISAFNIEVVLAQELLVIFTSKKEIDFQLDSLHFIFSRAKIEGRKIKKIDLRFDKPVVIYE